MKTKKPFVVTVGRQGYAMKEVYATFEHPEISGIWSVLEGPDMYLLCEDRGRHVRFVEFVKKPGDDLALYKGREWERRPRRDSSYVLTKHSRYNGTRMPTEFSQALKNIKDRTKT